MPVRGSFVIFPTFLLPETWTGTGETVLMQMTALFPNISLGDENLQFDRILADVP
jgi:hypothetical protein